MGAETEALGFGRNLLSPVLSLRSTSEDLDQLMEQHWSFLTSLAAFPQLDDGIRIDTTADRAYLGERFVKLPALFQLDESLRVTDITYEWDAGISLPVNLTNMWYGNRFVWVDNCERVAFFEGSQIPQESEYCALAGSLGSPGLKSFMLPNGKQIVFSQFEPVFEGMTPKLAYYESVIEQFRKRTNLEDAAAESSVSPPELVGDFVIRSSGGANAEASWVFNREQGGKTYLWRGLTLLGLNQGEAPVKVAHKDTCGWGGVRNDPDVLVDTDFATAIRQAKDKFGAFAIVAHSSVVCYEIDPHLKELFTGTEFTDWRDIWWEQPYIAILSGNGRVEEFVGARNDSLELEFRDFVRPEVFSERP